MPSVTTVTYGATVRAGAGAGAANPMAISAEGNQITVAATDRVTMHSLVVPDATTDQAIDLGECASVVLFHQVVRRSHCRSTMELSEVRASTIYGGSVNATRALPEHAFWAAPRTGRAAGWAVA